MGKFCYGDQTKNAGAARISQSKAYCQGLDYRAGGTALEKPKADNPFLSGSPDSVSWNLGWDLAEANAGSVMTKAQSVCCANPGVIAA